jgi:peptidoglycan/LPS O-acetylase OafA/YrhL
MAENVTVKQAYMTGLDGLRALAVFTVIGYHLGLPFIPGGFLGVTLFFVLSGYLITDILLSEWNKSGKISLKGFFIRRAKRLLPSVFFLLLCMAAYITVFRPDLLQSYKSDVLPAMFFFSNWWYIFRHVPYFSTFSNPSLLNHFWSLAVEGQFYLIWPALLILMQRFIRKPWARLAVTAAVAVLSAVLMAVLFQPGADPGRIYYGTDTRVFSLLLGACLAYVRPSLKLMAPPKTKSARILLELTGLAALAAVLYMSCAVTQYDDFLYLGGMFLFSAASLLLVAAAANPETFVGRFFSLRPLRYVGKISYGVYLWQFPVIVITNTMFPSNRLNIVLSVFQVAATILLASLSYYVIEMPIRRKQILASLRSGSLVGFCRNCLKLRWRVKTTALLVLTLILVSGAGLLGARAVPGAPRDDLSAPSQDIAPAVMPEESADQLTTLPPAASPDPVPDSPTPSVPGPAVSTEPAASADVSASVSPSTDEASAPAPTDSAAPPPAESPAEITPSDEHVTVVGDSVALDFAPYLRKYYPKLNVDAEEGRQFFMAKTIIKNMLKSNVLGSTVVVELGSNGSFSESSLRSLIDLIGSDRKIVFVNAQVPRSWCATVNDMLTKVCADYSNTVIADWYTASSQKSEYFYKDGFHPNTTGSPVLAKVVADAIEKVQD